MARTQTLVQLDDELVAALDREARRAGTSRSAIIRQAVRAYLATSEHDERVARYVDGYRRSPPATPGEWGDLGHEADVHGHELALRLDEEERRSGLSW